MVEAIIGIAVLIPLYRMVKGPTVWDRISGLSSSSSKSVVLLAVLGAVEHMDYLIYTAVVMAFLSLGTVAVLSHFLEE